MAQDVLLEWTDDGYLDIVFSTTGENGEEITEILDDESLGTAIQVSLFTNRRATEHEIPDTLSRSGFMGVLLEDGSHLGSGLHLLSGKRMTPQLLADAKNYAVEALQWLVDDGIADSLVVETENRDSRSLFIYIYLYKNLNLVGDYVTIWKNTVA